LRTWPIWTKGALLCNDLEAVFQEDRNIMVYNGLGYVVKDDILMFTLWDLRKTMSDFCFRSARYQHPKPNSSQDSGVSQELKDPLNVSLSTTLV
jgi:hypothetical protein